MGLFNHLFRKKNKKVLAQELAMDDAQRIALWEQHLKDHAQREELSKAFSPKNIERALHDPQTTDAVLQQIETLISAEIITTTGEEKLDDEIITDLQKLRNLGEIDRLASILVYENKRKKALLALFQEIHDVLTTELHLIRLIRKNPANTKDLLLQLFRIIFFHESKLYAPFKQESYFEENKTLYAEISALAHAVLREEEIKDKPETAEEKLAKKMLAQMEDAESEKEYRRLGENIIHTLAEEAGAPLEIDADRIEGMAKIEQFEKDDALLYSIIKKLKPKYDETKIHAAIIAFRKAYHAFEELALDFLQKG